jgi:tetratricopeptide (TPR) repeat protein
MIARLLALAVLIGVALAPRLATADDPTMRAAKRHFDRGEKLFALGKFDDALEEYQKAFDAKPIPDFLFNIGQCYRNLGDYDQAIFSFKKFLKLDPEAANREMVEKLIDDLEDKKARGDGQRFVRKHDGDNPPPPRHGKPFYKKLWFWSAVGAVTVAGGVGIYATRGGAPDTDLNPPIMFPK